MLRITTLGNFDIRLNEQSLLSQLSPGTQAMLVYLACGTANQQVSRRYLAELLWDGDFSGSAGNSLRNLLHRLPNVIGSFVSVSRQSVSLNEGSFWLDVDILQTNNASGEQISGNIAARSLEKSLALYQGEFLSDYAVDLSERFAAWVIKERQRLQSLVSRGYEQLTAFYIRTNQRAAATENASRWLLVDPWQEKACRQLMWLLAANGQRAEALQQYERLAELLRSEIDIAPEPATTDLYFQVLDGVLTAPPDLSILPTSNNLSLSHKRNGNRVGAAIVAILPEYDVVEELSRVSLFASCSDELRLELAQRLTTNELLAGQSIFYKGDPGRNMYIILRGKVRVHDDNRILNDLGERAIFGEMALLDNAPRLASAQALEDTTLLQLSGDDLYELMSENSQIMRAIIQVLSQRLRERVKDVVYLKTRLQTYGEDD